MGVHKKPSRSRRSLAAGVLACLLWTCAMGLVHCRREPRFAPPEGPNAAYLRALEQFQGSEWEGARRSIDQALAQAPHDSQYLSLKGRILLNLGDEARAATLLRRSVEAGANDFDTQMALAEALDALDRPEEAVIYAGAAEGLRPDDPSARYAHGLLLLKLEQFREAAKTLAAASDLLPGEPRILLALSEAERALGWLDAAQASANSALESAAEATDSFAEDRELQVEALSALAETALLRGKAYARATAQAYCEEAVRTAAESADARILAAHACLAGGAPDLALQWLDRGPTAASPDALTIRAQALLDLGQEPARALADVESALQQAEPREWAHLFLLRGRALQMLGRAKEARQSFERAAKIPGAPPSVIREASRRLEALRGNGELRMAPLRPV